MDRAIDMAQDRPESDEQAEDRARGKGKEDARRGYRAAPHDVERPPIDRPPMGRPLGPRGSRGQRRAGAGAKGRTYYVTVPIRTLSGHIPEQDLDRLSLYYALYGIVFAAVGAIAIILPLVFGVNVTSLLPWLLVLGGSVTLLIFLLICGVPGTTAFFLLSGLHMIAGLYLLVIPANSGRSFTYVIGGWFLLHGALKVFMAYTVRKITTWPVVLLTGITAMVLAFVIFFMTPEFGLKVIGIAFGADLAFTGVALLFISIMGFLGKDNRSVSDADLLDEPFLQENGENA